MNSSNFFSSHFSRKRMVSNPMAFGPFTAATNLKDKPLLSLESAAELDLFCLRQPLASLCPFWKTLTLQLSLYLYAYCVAIIFILFSLREQFCSPNAEVLSFHHCLTSKLKAWLFSQNTVLLDEWASALIPFNAKWKWPTWTEGRHEVSYMSRKMMVRNGGEQRWCHCSN